MLKKIIIGSISAIFVIALIWFLYPAEPTIYPIDKNLVADVEHGEHLIEAAGCFVCHTDIENDGLPFAGGPALDSPFGTFYAPNITPAPIFGIGNWSLYDFSRALRHGISPDNNYYYPSMPFLSYSGMTDQDVMDIWGAYLEIEPVAKFSKPHKLPFPFSIRQSLKVWRALFFTPEKPHKNDLSDGISRGEYLVRHVVHCSECHTPRNILGAPIKSKFLTGNSKLPDDNSSPDISTKSFRGRAWTRDDVETALSIGMLADGDFIGGSMADVIDYSTSMMNREDINAIVDYLFEE